MVKIQAADGWRPLNERKIFMKCGFLWPVPTLKGTPKTNIACLPEKIEVTKHIEG